MEKERFIVIGGVAAGMSAASRARAIKRDLEIVVFERNGYISHVACGMPYLISGLVKSADSLLVYSPQFFKENRNIDVHLHHEVEEILPQKKIVLVQDLETGRQKEWPYDHLLISTGARAIAPSVDGADLKGIFTLRRHEDGLAIRDYVAGRSPRHGLVVGAGYVGMEMAEAFSEAGMKVTVVEKMPAILGTMDEEIGEVVEGELKKRGVELVKSRAVVSFTGDGGWVKKAVLEGGDSIGADIALIGAGIRPNSEIARRAGIELGWGGAIKVSNRMETSVPGIYAAGDCAETCHLVLGRMSYVPLGTTANKQGRVAGENAAGGNASFAGVVGTTVFRVFGLEVGRTGITEKEARTEGIDCVSNVIEHSSRGQYMPGASMIRVKLIADPKTGRLLGAQMAGANGVSKRVDVLATAITARMTAAEVASLDLGYAPPFSPVYDPILIAAEQLNKRIPGTLSGGPGGPGKARGVA